MYGTFFGLQKEPFSIAPDPRFLYLSEPHREALAHLLYGLSAGGGFVLLTGEIGAGKTTVCRAFLEQVPPHCRVAYVFNPQLTVRELLQRVCQEFGVPLEGAAPASPPQASQESHGTEVQPAPAAPRWAETDGGPGLQPMVDALNRFLLAAHARGEQAVLVIDEAQALSVPVLEQLRLLTNLETAERKLLQVILIGQPELRERLAEPALEQLAQRIIARCHLPALTAQETPRYIRHRLAVAGPQARLPFDAAAMQRLHVLSGGVPRRINLLADRALLGAYARHQPQVDAALVEQAAREVQGGDRPGLPAGDRSRTAGGRAMDRPGRVLWWAGALVATLGLGVLLGAVGMGWKPGAASLPDPGLAAAGSAASAGGAADGPTGAVPAGPASAASAAQVAVAEAPAAVASAAADAATPAASSATASAPTEPAVDPEAWWAAAHQDRGTAWRELALLWRVAVGEGEACEAVRRAELACWTSGASAARVSAAGLPLVRQLQRPGIVVLSRGSPGSGEPRYALLLALGEGGALLRAGALEWRLSLVQLAQVWRGEFWTLWRVPPGWVEGAAASPPAGQAPALRQWVARQLPGPDGLPGGGAPEAGARSPAQPGAAAADTTPGGLASVPQAPLAERLRVFQLSEGLPADGLIGPMTLMALNRRAGVAEPPLAALP